MSEIKDLKDCPHCDGLIGLGNNAFFSWVECLSCRATTERVEKKEVAIGRWNTRTGGWISVEDRVPKDDETYLIYPVGKYAGPTAEFFPYDDFNGRKKNTFQTVSKYDEVCQLHVTHWQPLPEPPK